MHRYHITATDPADGMTIRIVYVAYTEQEALDHMHMYWHQYKIESITTGGK